jgi:hypothetical protein
MPQKHSLFLEGTIPDRPIHMSRFEEQASDHISWFWSEDHITCHGFQFQYQITCHGFGVKGQITSRLERVRTREYQTEHS